MQLVMTGQQVTMSSREIAEKSGKLSYLNFDFERFNEEFFHKLEIGEVIEDEASRFSTAVMDRMMCATLNVQLIHVLNPSQEEVNAAYEFQESTRMWAWGMLGLLCMYGHEYMRLEKAIQVAGIASTGLILAGYTRTPDENKKIFSPMTSTYLVKNPRTGLIKIGRSISPGQRVRTLSTASGDNLETLLLIPFDMEGELHKKFAEIRGVGEWFEDDGRIAEWIEQYKRGL